MSDQGRLPGKILDVLPLHTSMSSSHRVEELQGARPHSKGDAEWAAGMAEPDNGPKQAVQMER